MKTSGIALLSFILITGVCVAGDKPATAPMSDQQVIDNLVQQNKMLIAENLRLSKRPTTREEAFAMCMQAAKGDKGAMAAESVGEHCDQLLKQRSCGAPAAPQGK